MGDLNSFIDTPLLARGPGGGVCRGRSGVPSEEEWPYTYVFQGATQTLDHIVVSDGLFSKLILVDALHIDADYPIMDPDDPTPRHVSDHDPLAAFFSFAESTR